MAIKSQCINCKHYTSTDFCEVKGGVLLYDGSHCQERVKRESDVSLNVNSQINIGAKHSVVEKRMFKRPFSFDGRIRRLEYCLSFLIFMIYFFSMGIFVDKDIEDVFWIYAIWGILFIPMVWFFWAQGAKRCHDRGMSGWRQLNVFYQIWILFAKGDERVNIYGEPPK